MDCVNKNIPTRTYKEWQEYFKDKIKKKQREYKKYNENTIREYKKAYYKDNIDNIEHYKENKDVNKKNSMKNIYVIVEVNIQ